MRYYIIQSVTLFLAIISVNAALTALYEKVFELCGPALVVLITICSTLYSTGAGVDMVLVEQFH